MNSFPSRADAPRQRDVALRFARKAAGLCCVCGAGTRSKRYEARTESAGKYPPPRICPHVAQKRAASLRARAPHAGHVRGAGSGLDCSA
jgi:hypothetical protein